MFHLKVKPSPPSFDDLHTLGHDVDSSAIIIKLLNSDSTAVFNSRKNSIPSKHSFPPYLFGIHSPSFLP